MAKINLLPWRIELRKERQKEFAVMMGIAALIALMVWGAIHFNYVQRINYQIARNKYLEDQIVLLDKKIKEIEQLETEKQRLLDRMQAIERLETNRPLIVRLFDALVTDLPEGMSILKLEQNGNTLKVDGVAQSNARVSTFMRNIESSEWLKDPKLEVIQAKDEAGQRISYFTLRFVQNIPAVAEEEGGS
jgi:Tfp pilus assembly protein PilN